MAITSADIQEQIFSIDRKGYNSDEVDVFLERVADEVDYLNNRIAELEAALDAASNGDEWETPAAPICDNSEYEAKLLEKDATIASLNAQLEQRRADANAIAQALIVAQRSADTIIAEAKAKASQILEDATAEQTRIMDETEDQRQAVLDAIDDLEDEREAVRADYQEMLKNFISDATLKLANIEDVAPARASRAHATAAPVAAAAAAGTANAYQVPVNAKTESVFDTSSFAEINAQPIAVAATPVPVGSEKDFSGFGDVADDFAFDDLD